MKIWKDIKDEYKNWPTNEYGYHVSPDGFWLKIGNNAKIGEYANIGDGAEICACAEIGDGAKICDGAKIET